MKLFKKLSFVLSFLLLSSLSYAQNSQASLIGKWQSVYLIHRKAQQFEFKKNGAIIVNQILIADYKYKIKNNMLIDFLKADYAPGGIIIDTSYMRIKQDTIIRWYNRQGWKDTVAMIKDKDFIIKTKNKNNPLLGKWNWLYPTKDTATGIFQNDSTWRFQVLQNFNYGTYIVKGDTLKLSFQKGKIKRNKTFWIKGKLLEIKDTRTGNETLFKKIKD
jgi:hypothetical protein